MKHILFYPVLFLVLMGCGPVVTFNQPQPEGVDSLTVIPKKLVGTYFTKDGITSLVIDKKSMVFHSVYDVKQHKDSLNWDSMTADEKNQILIVGDSVVEHVTDTDTLFFLSENNVLKKYKGYYFLNSKRSEHSWFVQKLKLQKGLLTIASISTKEELATLEKINESPIDSVTYQVDFSKKQFHDYLDNDGFSEVDTFVRVK